MDKQAGSAGGCSESAGCMTEAAVTGAGGRRSHRAVRWGAVIVLCLLPAAIAFGFIHAYGVNTAYGDALYFCPLFEKYYQGTLTFQDLYAQHNEHRILFPRLVMLPLGLATRYNTVAEMYAGWGFICVGAAEVFLLCRRLYPDRLTAAAVFIPAAWILFSLGQYENLLWGWQMIFFMGNAFLLLSLYFLQRARRLDGWMIASAAAGLVASFSFSNMLLLWPIGLGIIVLKNPPGEEGSGKGRASALLFWGLFGAAVWAAYFVNWQKPGGHPSFLYGLRHPVDFVRYACFYVSGPLEHGRPGRAELAGAVLLLLYLGAAAVACRRWRKGNPLPAMPLALVLFALGTTLVTAVSRVGFGPREALESRYQTFSGLGLIGLYLFCLPLLAKVRLQVGRFDATSVLWGVLLLLLVIRPMYVQVFGEGYQNFGQMTLTAYHLRTASMQMDRDPKDVGANAAYVRRISDLLARLKFNVFARPPLTLSAEMRQVDEEDLPDSIELFMGRPVSPDSRTAMLAKETDTISVVGHAQDSAAQAPAGGVFIEVDGGMDIPAAYGLPRPDVAIELGARRYCYSGFEADFAARLLKPGRHSLRVKVVSADGKRFSLSEEALLLEISAPSTPRVEEH
jgi:hypothetical protein